jgi:dTDP-4-amino-4,6-dideoxygalactose transaminase
MTDQPIPILDLTREVEALWPELQEVIEAVLRSGHFIMGPNVAAFEAEMASYLGVRHAITVNSGTDALIIGLKSAGIGPGDEVITTPFTFFATAEAISHLGASPVFVDIDTLTFNLDPGLVEQALTHRTRALLPVHLYGLAAAMDPLLKLADRHDLTVVEDVAQACGAAYLGRKLGTLGTVGALSFFPSKNLGAYGDGGLIATDDDALATTARMLRVHGAKQKYQNEIVGYNSRLDELQAAMLRVKLPHLDRWNEGRRQVASRYQHLLKDCPGLVLPVEGEESEHVYHQFTVRIPGGRRDAVRRHLAKAKISSMIYYPVPLHRLPVYAGMNLSLPNAEAAAAEVLSLPIGPQMDDSALERVAETLREALSSMGG